MSLDPALIKIGIFALVFVAKSVTSANKKRQQKNRDLRPPQSEPLPPGLDSSRSASSFEPLQNARSQPKKAGSNSDSPWSDLK